MRIRQIALGMRTRLSMHYTMISVRRSGKDLVNDCQFKLTVGVLSQIGLVHRTRLLRCTAAAFMSAIKQLIQILYLRDVHGGLCLTPSSDVYYCTSSVEPAGTSYRFPDFECMTSHSGTVKFVVYSSYARSEALSSQMHCLTLV